MYEATQKGRRELENKLPFSLSFSPPLPPGTKVNTPTIGYTSWINSLTVQKIMMIIFFLTVPYVLDFSQDNFKKVLKNKMILKLFLVMSAILLGLHTVSAKPSQRGMDVLNRLQLFSDEVK